jgi:predicted nuclease with RNAse H fold
MTEYTLHPDYPFVGIDYGSKMAGTTAIAWVDGEGKLVTDQSEKKRDADAWLKTLIKDLAPGAVYLDAPLSLPGSYYGKSADYFYRECDRILGAMSPMFLGGLTARAMKLAADLPMSVHETYPAALVKALLLSAYYKKKDKEALKDFFRTWTAVAPKSLQGNLPPNWHQMDALLAWHSGWRHAQGKAQLIGRPSEGVIVV